MFKKFFFNIFLVSLTIFSFTQESSTFLDKRDGQIYKWVKIGNQIWMAENLRSTLYNDNTTISNVNGHSFITIGSNWDTLNINDKAYCWYNYDCEKYAETYGALYTWSATMKGEKSSNKNPSGVQGICPEGWHLPSSKEWSILIDYLGGDSIAGGLLKEKGTKHWLSPNRGATNSNGFTALPGGYCFSRGVFQYLNAYGMWWTTTDSSDRSAYYYQIGFYFSEISRLTGHKRNGCSVRCLKDLHSVDDIYSNSQNSSELNKKALCNQKIDDDSPENRKKDSIVLVEINKQLGLNFGKYWKKESISKWKRVKVKNNRVYSLDLSDLKIKNVSEAISNLDSLSELYMQSNLLLEIPLEIFSLKNLKILVLNRNDIERIPKEICQLQELKWLDLSNNKIKRLPEEIGRLSNLIRLDLRQNGIVNFPEEIGDLSNLGYLNLNFNYINNIPNEIGNLKNLEYLYIADNNLNIKNDNELPKEIGRLENLVELDLSINYLSLLPPTIGNLKNLKSLRIDLNELDSLPLEIGNLQKLKYVNYYGNNISKENINKIKELLPNCLFHGPK